jgi:WD40 repeat protein
MDSFLQLREIGGQQDLRRAQTSRLYHDLARATKGQFSEGHPGAVNALSFDNQGARYLVSAGAGSDISLWDCDSRKTRLRPVQKVAK